MSGVLFRPCLRAPIPEIAVAARHLDDAVTAHLPGQRSDAEELFRRADMPAIREWTEAIWGRKPEVVAGVSLSASSTAIPGEPRMPGTAVRRQLIERDGYHCRFCGIPVIRREIRDALRNFYPQAITWGGKNSEQHAGFQSMWLQFDHLLPHSKGGRNDLENMVITCGPCNFGRGELTLVEVRIIDPRTREPIHSMWDGLERVFRRKG